MSDCLPNSSHVHETPVGEFDPFTAYGRSTPGWGNTKLNMKRNREPTAHTAILACSSSSEIRPGLYCLFNVDARQGGMGSGSVGLKRTSTSGDFVPHSVNLYAEQGVRVEPPTPAVATRNVPEVSH